MTSYHPRSAWTSVPRPTAKLTPLAASQVRGVAVHYTGSKSRLGQTASLALSARRLEDERAYHVNGRGWSDLAYGAAIDVAGRVFDCRGIAYRSAANGNQVVNSQYGAVTWLLGVGDTPTDAMIEAFKDWRATVWLKAFPHATAVAGHRDLYSTECPGNPAYALVRSGALLAPPAATGGDDMALTDADAELLLGKLLDYVPGSQPLNLKTLWTRAYQQSAYNTGLLAALAEDETAQTDLIAALNVTLAGQADSIAARVVASLPSGPGAALSVADVRAAVRAVLVEGTGATG